MTRAIKVKPSNGFASKSETPPAAAEDELKYSY
jgi:hypothetical protein